MNYKNIVINCMSTIDCIVLVTKTNKIVLRFLFKNQSGFTVVLIYRAEFFLSQLPANLRVYI